MNGIYPRVVTDTTAVRLTARRKGTEAASSSSSTTTTHRGCALDGGVDGVDIQRHIRNLWTGYSICTAEFIAIATAANLILLATAIPSSALRRTCIANNNIIYLSVVVDQQQHQQRSLRTGRNATDLIRNQSKE